MLGLADVHNHQFANLGFGGVAFHGAAFIPEEMSDDAKLAKALPWCDFANQKGHPAIHGPGGLLDITGNLIGNHLGHKVGGYPKFDGWPRWDSITHQSVYETWLERAVQGGLRLMVMLAVNNESLTRIIARRPLGIADGPAVERQISAAHSFEKYIDEKNGGPGTGWYRIAYTPAQARRIIRDGKLAVILGVEVDYPFDGYPGASMTDAELGARVEKYFDMGIRHVFPVHFTNNAFGGTAFQNKLQMAVAANPSEIVNVSAANGLAETVVDAALHSYRVSVERDLSYEYRGGWRNTLGLTSLGRSLIDSLIERGMMIDIDHTSFKTRKDILDICENRSDGYPVVSGHTGLNDVTSGEKRHEGQLHGDEVVRIRRLGGYLALITNQGGVGDIHTYVRDSSAGTTIEHLCGRSSESFAQAYLRAIDLMDGRPVGIGTDFNGYIGQLGPRFGSERCPANNYGEQWRYELQGKRSELRYPFRASATDFRKELDRSIVGQKVFDFNVDGLAHVGMLPDLVADLEVLGLSTAEMSPLLHAASGYVDAWERAWRVAGKPAEAPVTSWSSLSPNGGIGIGSCIAALPASVSATAASTSTM